MLHNEQEVIRASQKGDTEAFGLLYDHYLRTIYNFVYYKTFHKETAEDLTSQTFFKALKNIQSVDPARPFLSWLYKIAQNSVLDHFRTKHGTDDIDDFWDVADESDDVVVDLDNAGQIAEIKKHLRKLPGIERDIIFMRVWQEMPYKDIALIVNKSEANCKMIYSRALKKLRDALPLAILLAMFLRL